MGAAGAQGERWFLADLDRDTIQRLQRARGEGAAPNAAQTAAAGWGTGDFKALPEVARNLIRTWLRAPLWLVPTVPRPAPRAAAPRGPAAALRRRVAYRGAPAGPVPRGRAPNARLGALASRRAERGSPAPRRPPPPARAKLRRGARTPALTRGAGLLWLAWGPVPWQAD